MSRQIARLRATSVHQTLKEVSVSALWIATCGSGFAAAQALTIAIVFAR